MSKSRCHFFVVYPGEPFCVMEEPPTVWPSLFHFAVKDGEKLDDAFMCPECMLIAIDIMPDDMRHDYELVMLNIKEEQERNNREIP